MSAQPSLDRSQLEAFWMPFTANRQFKANPRLLARASGMHYWTADGRTGWVPQKWVKAVKK